jgi:thiamine-monophosphate kinase
MISESDIIGLFQEDAHLLDDCAEIPPGPGILLVSTDSMSEGTHFRLDWSSAEDLAVKLVQINVSDLYASGAKPAWCFLNLGLRPELSSEFVRNFASGLKNELSRMGILLLGGDTFRSRDLQLQLTMGGHAQRHITRSGGRPGDHLYITGAPGLSLAGFEVLSGRLELPPELRMQAVSRHLRPIAAGPFPLEGVHAAMDVSDGIVQDSLRLARACGLQITIDLDALPVPRGLEAFVERRRTATSGEELDLLFLAPPGFKGFEAAAIGEAREGSGVVFREQGQVIVPRPGFSHFDSID